MERISKPQLLYQPTRLAIIAHLFRCGGDAAFVETCAVLGIKHAGLLSAHNRALEHAGYIKLRKSFVGRTTRTEMILTEQGRQAFADHLAALAAMTGAAPAKHFRKGKPGENFPRF
jgi:DNA-binding MarR family transcriptional regulator